MTHVANSEERFIKEQHHSKEEEEHPEASQPHSDFCGVSVTKSYDHGQTKADTTKLKYLSLKIEIL